MENKLEYMLKKLEGRKTKIQGQRPIRKMFVICEIKSEDGGRTGIFPEKTGKVEKKKIQG